MRRHNVVPAHDDIRPSIRPSVRPSVRPHTHFAPEFAPEFAPVFAPELSGTVPHSEEHRNQRGTQELAKAPAKAPTSRARSTAGLQASHRDMQQSRKEAAKRVLLGLDWIVSCFGYGPLLLKNFNFNIRKTYVAFCRASCFCFPVQSIDSAVQLPGVGPKSIQSASIGLRNDRFGCSNASEPRQRPSPTSHLQSTHTHTDQHAKANDEEGRPRRVPVRA